jgi:hypothetical protein
MMTDFIKCVRQSGATQKAYGNFVLAEQATA